MPTLLTNPPFSCSLTGHGLEGAVLDAVGATDGVHGAVGKFPDLIPIVYHNW